MNNTNWSVYVSGIEVLTSEYFEVAMQRLDALHNEAGPVTVEFSGRKLNCAELNDLAGRCVGRGAGGGAFYREPTIAELTFVFGTEAL